MSNFSGVIFDLDGTLVDSLPDIADAMNRTLRYFGYPVYSYEEYKYMVGSGLKNLVYKALPEDKKGDRYINETLLLMMREYGKSYADKTVLYEGIPELLDALTLKGCKLSVLSNKADSLTQKIVSALFTGRKFEVILGASERFPRKPAPDAALFIAERMNIPPGNILYTGDTNIDMQTANAAGMYAVGVSWGFRKREELEESGAETIINHPMDLMELL
ncbi:MAG: HAD family hydrolase [Dysgonamonadaceae bacterium]|jgi:phosphoglycolate phosphatase|nr:HAD family hydrolase [Dysgonamonadaceae bacterium]